MSRLEPAPLAARLRAALVLDAPDPPAVPMTGEAITARLREACALADACRALAVAGEALRPPRG